MADKIIRELEETCQLHKKGVISDSKRFARSTLHNFKDLRSSMEAASPAVTSDDQIPRLKALLDSSIEDLKRLVRQDRAIADDVDKIFQDLTDAVSRMRGNNLMMHAKSGPPSTGRNSSKMSSLSTMSTMSTISARSATLLTFHEAREHLKDIMADSDEQRASFDVDYMSVRIDAQAKFSGRMVQPYEPIDYADAFDNPDDLAEQVSKEHRLEEEMKLRLGHRMTGLFRGRERKLSG
jgi:hypothetical protein